MDESSVILIPEQKKISNISKLPQRLALALCTCTHKLDLEQIGLSQYRAENFHKVKFMQFL